MSVIHNKIRNTLENPNLSHNTEIKKSLMYNMSTNQEIIFINSNFTKFLFFSLDYFGLTE
jgi:hypothetical protein